MDKVDVYNIKNEKVGDVSLDEGIFNVDWKPDLIHFLIVAQQANAREAWAHAKDRGEVRGGGRKPWRQKGTGRARHGSTRSPIWTGGGVAHGPLKEKDYSKKVNKKQTRFGLFSVLSRRLADNNLKVIDSLEKINKTKDFASGLSALFADDKKTSVTIISASKSKNVNLSSRNIPGVDSLPSNSLNVFDILKRRNLLIEKSALDEMVKNYSADKVVVEAKEEVTV